MIFASCSLSLTNFCAVFLEKSVIKFISVFNESAWVSSRKEGVLIYYVSIVTSLFAFFTVLLVKMAQDEDAFKLSDAIPMGYELKFPWYRVIQAVVSLKF